MIVVPCEQGGVEWHAARLGIPTASQFQRVMTAKTRKLSASADKYLHELVAEAMIGEPATMDPTGFMQRGTALEAQAVAFYEFERNVETQQVGFCLSDDRSIGCSPDRLVGEDGGLEIKCPSASVHVANMLNMTDDHWMQCQGGMLVTGRAWWDLVSYHPEIPSVIVRIERDAGFIADLDFALRGFCQRLADAKRKLGVAVT